MIDTNCKLCGLSETRRVVVQPDRRLNTRVLILGRDPGGDEDNPVGGGIPFVGPAGRLLKEIVNSVGLSAVVSYDNVVHCHTPGNRGPRAEEVIACRVWLRLVVQRINPRVIVTLGQEATEAVLGPLLGKNEGKWIWDSTAEYTPKKPKYPLGEYNGKAISLGEVTVFPAYHPSAGLRNTNYRRLLVGALRNVAAHIGVKDKSPQWIDAEEVEGDEVAVDIEWRMDTGEVLGYGVAWWAGEDVAARWIVDPAVLQEIVRGRRVILWNAKGDLEKLAENGVEIAEYEDGMLMAFVLGRQQETGSLGLKECAGVDLELSWTTLVEMGKPEEQSEEDLSYYCLCDTVATLLLTDEYRARLEI